MPAPFDHTVSNYKLIKSQNFSAFVGSFNDSQPVSSFCDLKLWENPIAFLCKISVLYRTNGFVFWKRKNGREGTYVRTYIIIPYNTVSVKKIVHMAWNI